MKPLKVTFWQMKGHQFVAPGKAEREYKVISVKPKSSIVQRVDSGRCIPVETEKLIEWINAQKGGKTMTVKELKDIVNSIKGCVDENAPVMVYFTEGSGHQNAECEIMPVKDVDYSMKDRLDINV